MQALEQARTAATFGWDASPISTARLSAELWNAIKDHDWTNVGGVGGGALWNMDKHYQVIDGGGVAAEGGDLPTAVVPRSLTASMAVSRSVSRRMATSCTRRAPCGRLRITASRSSA